MIFIASILLFLYGGIDPQHSLELCAGLTSTHRNSMSKEAENVIARKLNPRKYPLVESGTIFGRLTVVEDSGPKMICVCQCGTQKHFKRINVITGLSQSCGCLRLENKSSMTHGMTGSKEYRSWEAMKRRCLVETDPAWPDYGGRGITVCERWMKFENFFEDMGLKPTPDHQIERIDNDGNYCPENCKWATRKEECRNRRSNLRIAIHGDTKTLVEWCEIYNRTYSAVRLRISRRGWEPLRALETPIMAFSKTSV